MPRWSAIASLILCIVFSPLSGRAQTCCSGGVPMSGNLGLPADSKGTLQLALNYDINVLRTLKFENETLNDRTRERVTHSLLFEGGYSITPRISVDVLASIVDQSRRIIAQGGTNESSTRGLGDLVVLAKYQITKPESNSIFLVGAGSKLATGRVDFRNEQGIQYGADLQPGSGAIDGIGWVSFSTPMSFRPSLNLVSTAVIRLTGENKNYLGLQVYEFGDEVQWLLGFSDRINIGRIVLDPSLSLRYRYAGEDFVDGNAIPNTGGQWIFAVPSISLPLSNNLALNAAVDLPIYGKPTGIQLSPTYRANAGIFLRINKNEELDIIDL